jgi:RNA polymerase sigma-70 factor (ECF subfamily)
VNNVGHNDEKSLLLLLREGNHTAFEILYNRHSPQLLLKLDGKLPEAAQVDDIVQELFVKLWERREQIDPEKPFAGYLYRIAQRMLIDHYRRIARNTLLYKEVIHGAGEITNFTEEAFAAKETQQLLDDALKGLTPRQQEVFQLCKIQGRSYKEAAEILEISPETVHVHLVKATQAVKSHLFTHQKYISGALAVALILSERLLNS